MQEPDCQLRLSELVDVHLSKAGPALQSREAGSVAANKAVALRTRAGQWLEIVERVDVFQGGHELVV